MKTNNIKEIQTKVLVRVIDLINSIINSMINSTINSMINSIIKITPMDIITTMDIRILAQKASSLANSMEITIIIIIISLIIMSIKRKMDLVKSFEKWNKNDQNEGCEEKQFKNRFNGSSNNEYRSKNVYQSKIILQIKEITV